jgi:hypothetical protein
VVRGNKVEKEINIIKQPANAGCFFLRTAKQQQKGGEDFAALPQIQNSFYTVFVRFGLILPIKSLFLKKVINTRRFAAKSFVYSFLPLISPLFYNPFTNRRFSGLGGAKSNPKKTPPLLAQECQILSSSLATA